MPARKKKKPPGAPVLPLVGSLLSAAMAATSVAWALAADSAGRLLFVAAHTRRKPRRKPRKPRKR